MTCHHELLVCECGVLIRTCRCPAPKQRRVVRPCQHKAGGSGEPPARPPLPPIEADRAHAEVALYVRAADLERHVRAAVERDLFELPEGSRFLGVQGEPETVGGRLQAPYSIKLRFSVPLRALLPGGTP